MIKEIGKEINGGWKLILGVTLLFIITKYLNQKLRDYYGSKEE